MKKEVVWSNGKNVCSRGDAAILTQGNQACIFKGRPQQRQYNQVATKVYFAGPESFDLLECCKV